MACELRHTRKRISPLRWLGGGAFDPGGGGAGGEETGISLPLAAKIRDWQTLLFAVEDMIADQHDFVAWWDANVTLGQSPGTNQWSVADRQPTISAEDVTALTGIQKWQVSRWRTALANEDAYHRVSTAQGRIARQRPDGGARAADARRACLAGHWRDRCRRLCERGGRPGSKVGPARPRPLSRRNLDNGHRQHNAFRRGRSGRRRRSVRHGEPVASAHRAADGCLGVGAQRCPPRRPDQGKRGAWRNIRFGQWAIVAARPFPRLVLGRLSPSDFAAVSDWIRLNEAALVDYWNYQLLTDEFVRRLRRLP